MTQSRPPRGPKLVVIGCAAVALGLLPVALWLVLVPEGSSSFSVWLILLAAWAACSLTVTVFLRIVVLRDIRSLTSSLYDARLGKDGLPKTQARELTALRDALENALQESYENQSRVTERSENLLRLNNHRIKNSLQLVSSVINLHTRELKDPALRTNLLDLRYRVFSLSAIHDELFEGDGDDLVNLEPILTNVVSLLVRTLNEGVQGPALKMDFDPIKLDTERALPVCFLLTEMITCAHQMTAKLGDQFESYALSMVESPRGQINLSLVARLPSKVEQSPNALNQKILAALSQQLGGTHKFTKNNNALTLEVNFPLEQ